RSQRTVRVEALPEVPRRDPDDPAASSPGPRVACAPAALGPERAQPRLHDRGRDALAANQLPGPGVGALARRRRTAPGDALSRSPALLCDLADLRRRPHHRGPATARPRTGLNDTRPLRPPHPRP